MKLLNVLLLTAFAALAQTPAGWQTMKDKKQLCQISVPAGWTADKIMVSSLSAPDKTASLIFSSKPESASFADITKMAKDMFKPAKSFEDTANKTWFAETAKIPGQTAWYLALNTKPVCEVEIKFKDAAFEATAKQIVSSLKSTR